MKKLLFVCKWILGLPQNYIFTNYKRAFIQQQFHFLMHFWNILRNGSKIGPFSRYTDIIFFTLPSNCLLLRKCRRRIQKNFCQRMILQKLSGNQVARLPHFFHLCLELQFSQYFAHRFFHFHRFIKLRYYQHFVTFFYGYPQFILCLSFWNNLIPVYSG